MSNSAFTPSVSTVTNNVPTNVPIITDWTAYTPTLTNFGSKGTNVNTAFWRRNGADIEIIFTYNGNAVAAGAGATSLQWSLPSGLTFDTTKLPNGSFSDDNYVGSAKDYSVTTNALYSNSNQIVPVSATNFSIVKGGSGAYFTTDTLNIARNAYFSGQLKAPISQWAGSGTTTLATRAVEEYGSSTTGTWDAAAAAGNTVLGPSGSPITGDLTGTRSKVSRFSSAVQATDSLILEFKNSAGNWIPSHLTNSSFLSAPPTFFGAYISSVSGTDVQITFSQYAYPGTTWGSNTGAGGWSASDAKAWRVRKISGGAQVGYPVSARNIIGDTSGTSVPTGMIGEILSSKTSAATSTTTGVYFDAATITLSSSGTYRLDASVRYVLNGATITLWQGELFFGTTAGNSTAGFDSNENYWNVPSPATTNADCSINATQVINYNSSTGVVTFSGGATMTLTGGILRLKSRPGGFTGGPIQYRAFLTATRIA